MASGQCQLSRLWIVVLDWATRATIFAGAVLFLIVTPGRSITQTGLVTVGAACVGLGIGMRLRSRRAKSLDLAAPADGLVLIVLSVAIVARTLPSAPLLPAFGSVYSIQLVPYYLIIHGGFVALVVSRLFSDASAASRAELALVGVILHSVLNTGLFPAHGGGIGLLWGMTLVAAMALIMARDPPSIRWIPPSLSLPLMGFVVAAVGSTVFSVFPLRSLEHLIRLLCWIAAGILCVVMMQNRERIRRLLFVLVALMTVIAVAACHGGIEYARCMGWESALRARLQVSQVHANGLGIVSFTFALLFAGLWPTARGPGRGLVGVSVLLLAAVGFATYSRMAFLGLAAGMAVLLVGSRPQGRGRSPFLRTVMVVCLLALPLFLAVGASNVRGSAGRIGTRLTTWKLTAGVLARRPLLGVGMGNHLPAAFVDFSHEPQVRKDEVVSGRREPLSIKEALDRTRLMGWHAHNLLLQVGEGVGIGGMGCLLLLLAATARKVVSAIRRTGPGASRRRLISLTASNVCLVTGLGFDHAMADNSLLPVEVWVLWGTLIASALVAGTSEVNTDGTGRSTREHGEPTTRYWLMVAAFTLALVLVLWPGLAASRGESIAREKSLGDSPRRQTKEKSGGPLPWSALLDPSRYTELGDRTEGAPAIRWYRRAIALRPFHAPYWERLGWLEWEQGDLSGAIEAFRYAVRCDPYALEGTSPLAELGLAFAAAGEQEEAIDAFRDAVIVDPTSLRAPDWCVIDDTIALAPAYNPHESTRPPGGLIKEYIGYHLGRRDAAPSAHGSPTITLDMVVRRLLDPVFDSDPLQARFNTRVALRLYEHWNRPTEVLRTLARLDQLTPQGTCAEGANHMARSRILWRLGRPAQAIQEAERAVSLHDWPVFHHELGLMYKRKRMYDRAIEALERAAHSWDPSAYPDAMWPRYWTDLADAYLATGRLEEALRAFDRAKFLGLQAETYGERMIAIGRSAAGADRSDVEIEAYRRVFRVVAAVRENSPSQRSLPSRVASGVAHSATWADQTPAEILGTLRGGTRLPRHVGEAFCEAVAVAREGGAR